MEFVTRNKGKAEGQAALRATAWLLKDLFSGIE